LKICKRLVSCLLTAVLALTALAPMSVAAEPNEAQGFQIVVGKAATDMQEYAAKELQKYLYQLSGTDVPIVTETEGMDLTNAFVLGTLEANSQIGAVKEELDSIAQTGAEGHEGEQGYVLKKAGSTLYIGGTDDEGALYGVYGLLDDYYGIGFYFSGDVIPEEKTALYMPEVDEAKTPRQYMRGVLPWTNFPQSATVYSTEDWMHIIDQMARMRMNFLNIHNYNGELGHNEMYHNFTYNGNTSRNWNPTAKSGHSWGGPGWDVNQYLFGASDLFDDYDFGSDSAIHNDNLNNVENFAKGSSQFQMVINYAHTRGVKMGLGLDINLIPEGYGAEAKDPGVIKARTDQIMEDYKDLDVLLLYLSENVGQSEGTLNYWKECFNGFYSAMKEGQPETQLAISGWGVRADIAAYVPDDVIVAPIADYSSGFVNGEKVYGENKEFWGGPWVERDFDSSVYFYPFNMGLDQTIASYQENKDTMQGMFTLTWRLTDGVDAKIAYVAKAPWDREERYNTEESIYREYAEKCYGDGAADDMTKLIYADEKTVVPTLWSECRATPGFTNGDRSADVEKMQGMIDRVDAAIGASSDSGCIDRLEKLRSRLVCAQYYCKLDQSFNSTPWENLQDDFSVWAQSFTNRVDDISSLGNVQSSQNRFVQLRYVGRETSLRNAQTIKAPMNVTARGTTDGAALTWTYEADTADGFLVYRDGEKITETPLGGDVREFTDTYDGEAAYTVTAVTEEGESEASIPQACEAGAADKTAPRPIVVSPPTSVRAGQDMALKVRILDERNYDELSAAIHYRAMGSGEAFAEIPMEHRVKGTFAASVPTGGFADSGIEYYISVSDGANADVWPATAGEGGLNAVCTVYTDGDGASVLRAPSSIAEEDGKVVWNDAGGDVFWYKIYRGDTPDFTPSGATYVTYVEKGTTSFKDVSTDFDGTRLSEKTSYYRVTAVDRHLNESIPTMAVQVGSPLPDPLSNTLFVDADKLYKSKVAPQAGSSTGSVVGYTEADGYAMFKQLPFSKTVVCNSVEVTYSAGGAGAMLEVHADAPDGELLGEANLPGTGGWGNFTTVTIPVDMGEGGTRDIYFVYRGGYNLDYFRFSATPETSADDIVITTKDMMAFRSDAKSDMKGTASEISGFGNTGDRIALGKGYYVSDTEHASASKATGPLPGYGMDCFFFGHAAIPTAWVQFSNLPAGKAWFAYDKGYTAPEHKLGVYVNDNKTSDIALPGSSGSNWDTGVFKIMYADTGVTLEEGDTIKIQNDVACPANGIKLFVENPYSAKQVDITYSNNADTRYSLYVNGEKQESITLTNSEGRKKLLSVPVSVEDGFIELVAEEEDIAANNNARSTIYNMVLCKEAKALTKTITVTAGQGGTVTAENGVIGEDGTITVPYGESQRFDFHPDEGYAVEKVLVNGADYGQRSSYTFENLNYDATLEVAFSQGSAVTEYAVNIGSTPGGQIISDLAKAQKNQPVTLEVRADEGYHYAVGTLRYLSASHPDGVAISDASTQFSMPGEGVTVTAEFVENDPVLLEGITLEGPEKTEYEMGEELDLTGLMVTAHYSDGSTAPAEDYETAGFDSETAGEKIVTVSYTEGGITKTADFTVIVKQRVLTGITVVPPSKTEYEVGEPFDSTGMEVTAEYSNGDTELVEEYAVSEVDTCKPGEKTVTVTYQDQTAVFTIQVKERVLTGIEVIVPDKTDYLVGEAFDPTGMVVNAVYSNSVKEEISQEDYTVDGFDSLEAGEKTLTVTYQEMTAEFTVTVTEEVPEPVLAKIVLTPPEKTEYKTGETVDTQGLVVYAHYSDGTYTELPADSYEVTVPELASAGIYYVTVTYEDMTAEYMIVAEEEPVNVPHWEEDRNGWWYNNGDGTYPKSCWKLIADKWYYFDRYGYRMTGWVQDGQTWYYCEEDGTMQTGWLKDGTTWYYLKSSGAMACGWVQVGTTWYYMSRSGAMQTGWVQIGKTWYYLNQSGAMQTGWVKTGSTWYYMSQSGAMQTGWIKDGKTWYYLNKSGAMQTGWVKDGKTWYYLKNNGAMATGWVNVSGKWYYLNENGGMASKTWIGKYFVNGSGVWSKTR
jgi:glucan-binding YG repeat protein